MATESRQACCRRAPFQGFGRVSLVALLAASSLISIACIRKVGRTINDNFYVLNAREKKPKGDPDAKNVFGQTGNPLSDSISETLKAQAKTSTVPKSAVSNAELLEKQQPELAALSEVLKNQPSSSEAHCRLARLYHELRMYDQAQVHYERAIQIEPENSLYFEHFGRLWRDWGVPVRGVDSVQAALRLKPDFVEAWNTLGTVYDRAGDGIKAQESYRKALSIDSTLDYVHSNLCYSYLKSENFTEAVRHGEEAVRLAPASSVAHNNLGIAYGMQGLFEKAYSEFRQAGDEAVARNNLGLVLLKMDRIGEAMREFRLAARSKPFYRVAAENYAVARDIHFRRARQQKLAAAAKQRDLGIGPAPETVIVPISQVASSLLENSLIAVTAERMLPLPAWPLEPAANRARPVVNVEIESSARLRLQRRILGDFLGKGPYHLTDMRETTRGLPRTVIYYQPGYSQLALDLAHRIPGNQMVLRADSFRSKAHLRVVLGTDIVSQGANLQAGTRGIAQHE